MLGSIPPSLVGESQRRTDTMKYHGFAKRGQKTVEYIAWINMKSRCYNKNNDKYIHYGANGIVVCHRWMMSFQNFIDDMGKRPEGKSSIDRKDTTKEYSPGNCQWATQSEQMRNTKQSRRWIIGWMVFNTAKEVGEFFGTNTQRIRNDCNGRIYKSGTFKKQKHNCISEEVYCR